jgi:hypothetical protein
MGRGIQSFTAAGQFSLSLLLFGLRFKVADSRPSLHVVVDRHHAGCSRNGASDVQIDRVDRNQIRIAPKPLPRVKPEGFQALIAARNAALLAIAERGFTCAEIAAFPWITLDERTIRQEIAKARRLRAEQGPILRRKTDPRITRLFGG